MKKLIPLFLLLAGCTDSTVYLKNEKTGEVVKCGSVHELSYTEAAFQRRDAQCIQDYKEQGFVRIPDPKAK